MNGNTYCNTHLLSGTPRLRTGNSSPLSLLLMRYKRYPYPIMNEYIMTKQLPANSREHIYLHTSSLFNRLTISFRCMSLCIVIVYALPVCLLLWLWYAIFTRHILEYASVSRYYLLLFVIICYCLLLFVIIMYLCMYSRQDLLSISLYACPSMCCVIGLPCSADAFCPCVRVHKTNFSLLVVEWSVTVRHKLPYRSRRYLWNCY